MHTQAARVKQQIAAAVDAYVAKRADFETDARHVQDRLLANAELRKLIHSIKWRAKDPAHLKDKLERRAFEADASGMKFSIDDANVFAEIPDLAGVRLLHLHMGEISRIHPLVLRTLEDDFLIDREPEAKTWDYEYERMLRKLGLKVVQNESLYTSIHYVIRQNSTTQRLCELQVRTLAEEVWGEVSHTINYPHETDSVSCKEQLKVLARVVTTCSRLVDSIIITHDDHVRRADQKEKRRRRAARKR